MLEKAEELAHRLNIGYFRGSEGWLVRFIKHCGMTFQKQAGEAGAMPEGIVEEWLSTTLFTLIDGYAPKGIYNYDETALIFKL